MNKVKGIRFSIARRLRIAFIFILLAVLATSYITFDTLHTNTNEYNKINTIYTPSAALLHDLHNMITNSKMLIKNWVYIDKKDNTPDKMKLLALIVRDYPKMQQRLDTLFKLWSTKDQKAYTQLCKKISLLFEQYTDIMQNLNTFENYDNMMIWTVQQLKVEPGGEVLELIDDIEKDLIELVKTQEMVVEKSTKEMEKSNERFKKLIVLIAVMLVSLMMITGFIVTRVIVNPINVIKNVIQEMGRGVLPEQQLKVTNDEMGDMSLALNNLFDSLRIKSLFADKIGNGNLEIEFQPLSEQDVLGNSLLRMRTGLYNAKVLEIKHKTEEEKRNWASLGVALFSDILRDNAGNVEKLASEVIRHLVEYTNSSIGGMYYLNDDDKENSYLELIATKGFTGEKNHNKQISASDGLLGDVIKERKPVYLRRIPPGYLKVTSGLGETEPISLLIVPLMQETETLGAIEIASLNEIEEYRIDFVKQISIRVASTLLSIKNNQRTLYLLEQTRYQAEQLSAQEEELRQNLDELQMTHDEMVKTQKELKKANEQLKQNEESLERKVLERTEQINQQKEELLMQSEHLQQANEEILATNEALQQQKEELQVTLENLKQTQSKLVQSEKMASLGQLIAGIAHEINTPLGAIKSSIGTINDSLVKSLQLVPELVKALPEEMLALFMKLLERGMMDRTLYTSKDERKFKRDIREFLESSEVTEAENIADTLIDMNVRDDVGEFLPLFKHEKINLILQTGYSLSVQLRNGENIKTAVERAAKVVFALRTYARYDHSNTKIKSNLTDGIETVLTLYHNQLKHGIEVSRQYDVLPMVLCYPDELNQVWTNLVHNAIQAMNGKGAMKITAKQNYDVIEVRFIDNGPGIPLSIQEKIFEPFFTTKASGEGSGLGLNIVQKIIEKHNGTISVNSEPGKGAEFVIEIPINSDNG